MDSQFGLIGSGWQDYHDQQIQPMLDQYDQQINDILANGAHGAIAQMQAEDDAGGAGFGGGASGAGANARARALASDTGGQFQQAGISIGGQAASPPSNYLDASLSGSTSPASAALLGALADPQSINLKKAGVPDASRYVAGNGEGGGPEQNLKPNGDIVQISGTNDSSPHDDNRARQAMDAANQALNEKQVLGTVYPDFHAALGAWSDAAQPIQSRYDTEVASKIYAVPGGWKISPAFSNGSHCSDGGRCGVNVIGGDDGELYTGYIHTHPSNGGLDNLDSVVGRNQGVGAYVSLPNGQINGWMPGLGLIDDAQPEAGQFAIRARQR